MAFREIVARFAPEVIAAIDADAARRSTPTAPVSRAAVIRMALAKWLATSGKSHKKGGGK